MTESNVLRGSYGALAAGNRPADLFSLMKPRITLMVLITAGAGFLLGSGGSVSGWRFLVASVGIGLVAGGTSALNQVLERDIDARMDRTRGRPLPAGKVSPGAAWLFSILVSCIGIVFLAVFVNALTAWLAIAALLTYVLVYTPLKRVSSLSTLVGAVPGALPIMGGWTAATGSIDPGAWALFGILFFWQLPHFLALAWMYRADYRRGGFKMLGVSDPEGRQTRHQSVLYAVALLPASLLPALLGISGGVYAFAALLLTGIYVASAFRFALRADSPTARGLFRVSLLYLPVLLLVLTLDGGSGRKGVIEAPRDAAVVVGSAAANG
ncbi:MAG: heme o synthase [Candidatus Palauibacterales bacterium]|nr:heme o synthase [Candidatus Palauibacterales bacterium]